MSSRTISNAKTKDGSRPVGPPVPPSAFRQGVRFVFVGLPSRAAWLVRILPWWQKLILAAVIVAGIGGSGYFFIRHRAEERRQAEIRGTWQLFEVHAKVYDADKMKEDLQHLSKLDPQSPLVKKRLESMERGSSDPDDGIMITYWMNANRVYGHPDKAIDEAKKRIKLSPHDWQANCILAQQALVEGNTKQADFYLDALPTPYDENAHVSPFDLQFAMELFSRVKRDDSLLRRFRATELAPMIKNSEITRNDPRAQIQLLRSYVRSLEDIDVYSELLNYWVGANRVAESLLRDKDSGVEILSFLGDIEYYQFFMLNKLAKEGRISEEHAAAFREEMLERMQEIWAKVRRLKPDSPDGYFGGAIVEEWLNRRDKAHEFIKQAREVAQKSGDKRRYLEWEANFLRRSGNAGAEYTIWDEERAKNPKQPSILKMFADASFRTHRLDEALQASREARDLDPSQTWPVVMEARILLEQEETDQALEVLKRYKTSAMKDGALAALYVQAEAAKSPKEIRPFLDTMLNNGAGPDVMAPCLWAALRAGLADDAAEVSHQLVNRLLKSDSRAATYNRDLLLVEGDSNLAAAAPKSETGSWDRQKLDIAIGAYRAVQEKEPGKNNLQVANSLAWTYVAGFSPPQTNIALQEAAPLFSAVKEGHWLPAYMLDTLAAIELERGNGHFDAARSFATRAIDAASGSNEHIKYSFAADSTGPASAPAEYYVHLARAYIGLNQADEARRSLQKASSLPLSPYVSQELKKAQTSLEKTP